MKILSTNVRSLNSNYELVNDLTIQNGLPEVIAMQEVWNIRDFMNYKICGYEGPFYKGRENSNGGGCGFYIKEGVEFKIIELPFYEKVLECMAIEIKASTGSILLVNCYRPPNNFELGLRKLKEILKIIEGKIFLLIGDFNIDIKKGTLKSTRYIGLLGMHGMKNLNFDVTRVTSGTCLDHVITGRGFDLIKKVVVLNQAISDHQVIEVLIDLNYEVKEEYSNKRFFNKKELDKLKSLMDGTVINDGGVNEMYEEFLKKIQLGMDSIKKVVRKKNKRLIPENL